MEHQHNPNSAKSTWDQLLTNTKKLKTQYKQELSTAA
jgi:hypothetical protein